MSKERTVPGLMSNMAGEGRMEPVRGGYLPMVSQSADTARIRTQVSRQGSLPLDFDYLYLYSFKNWVMLSLYRVGQKTVCSYLALSC